MTAIHLVMEDFFVEEDDEDVSSTPRHSDSEPSDYDYPDHDDDDNNNDGDNNDDTYANAFDPDLDIDNELIITEDIEEQQQQQQQQSKERHCDVCQEQFFTFQKSMSNLDMFNSLSTTEVYQQPCKEHWICGLCIRDSLLKSTIGVLKDGCGDFPCLANSTCQNSIKQRTTTELSQLQGFFLPSEWQRILHIRKSLSSPNELNHRFLVPLTSISQANDNLILTHMWKHWSSQVIFIQCPVCEIHIEKTSQCNAMQHCDWEVCWCCGWIERRISPSHWIKCPRYDHEPIWKKYGYQCEDGKCYNDQIPCSTPAHQVGISQMKRCLKVWKMGHWFLMLNQSQQTKWMNHIQANGHLKNWQQTIKEFDLFKKWQTVT